MYEQSLLQITNCLLLLDSLSSALLAASCQLYEFVLTCFSALWNYTKATQLTDSYFISFSCFTAHYCHSK